jgi:hypothetical protein
MTVDVEFFADLGPVATGIGTSVVVDTTVAGCVTVGVVGGMAVEPGGDAIGSASELPLLGTDVTP